MGRVGGTPGGGQGQAGVMVPQGHGSHHGSKEFKEFTIMVDRVGELWHHLHK